MNSFFFKKKEKTWVYNSRKYINVGIKPLKVGHDITNEILVSIILSIFAFI